MPAPREPDTTCSSIDAVQKAIRDAADELEYLRDDNEALRKWGTYWQEQAERFEDELATAEARISELESEAEEDAA